MEPVAETSPATAWPAAYAKIRPESYVILASLLGRPPSEDVQRVLQNLQWDGPIPEKVDRGLRALRQASQDYALDNLQEEYGKLFIGLGCGEVVPYASWYREKRIQASPLAALRSDLLLLGIVRQADNHEPEDHAASLCESLALISREPGGRDQAMQADFFQKHVAPWMTTFFKDLEAARSARFYRMVGIFGRRFLESEAEYLKLDGGQPCAHPKRRNRG